MVEHFKIDIAFIMRWRTQQNLRVELKIGELCIILRARACFIRIMKTVQLVFSNDIYVLFYLLVIKKHFFIIAAPSSMAFFGLDHHITNKCYVYVAGQRSFFFDAWNVSIVVAAVHVWASWENDSMRRVYCDQIKSKALFRKRLHSQWLNILPACSHFVWSDAMLLDERYI